MRLIDADALNDVVMRLNAKGDSGITRSEYKLIDSVLFEFPTIEAETVRHGKWIDKSGGIEGAWNYCSVCGERAIELYDYCPNCGAKMEDDNETN